MNKRTYLINVCIGLVILVILGVLYMAYLSTHKQKVLENSSETKASAQAVLDPKSIVNFDVARASVEAGSSQYYSIDIKNLYKTQLEGKDVYIGYLDQSFGNGVSVDNPQPVFIINNEIFVFYGFGGHAYPLDQSNWRSVYQDMNTSTFLSLEDYFANFTQNGSWMNAQRDQVPQAKIKAGIDEISISQTPTYKPLSVSIKKAGVEATSDKFEPISDINLALLKRNRDTIDPITISKQNRPKEGLASGPTRTYISQYGFKVSFPSEINHQKVIWLGDDPIFKSGDSMFLEGDINHTDSIYLSCNQYNSPQIGPKTGQLDFVASTSQALVEDWGVAPQSYGDRISFSTKHWSCTLNIAGSFRSELILIDLHDQVQTDQPV
jgi:hypothetical protein